MLDLKKLKIYQHGFAGSDWGFEPSQFVDVETALVQPCSIAAVMVMCNEPDNFSFTQEIKDVDLSRFDLVLLTSVEFIATETIYAWAKKQNIQHFLLAQGSKQKVDREFHHDARDVIYRPWWAFNIVNSNDHQLAEFGQRPYLFECLLGARRPHRDFAMLSFHKNQLLESSIVTYRNIFHGNTINEDSYAFAQRFDQELLFPYVSANLAQAWESTYPVTHNVSSKIPWQIYNRCYYSVVCETYYQSDNFFLSEKTGKAMLGQRLFVHIGSFDFLKQLHGLGFETFGDIVDQSYDSIHNDIERCFTAFDQVISLAKENPKSVLGKVWPRLLHNRQRMIDLQKESKQRMVNLLAIKIQSLI